MLDVITLINAGVCILLCALLTWLVLAPTVSDGIVIKAGLVTSAVGLLGCALVLLGAEGPEAWRPLLIAWLLVHMGTLIIMGGVLLRVYRDPEARQVAHAITGWPPLGTDDGHAH